MSALPRAIPNALVDVRFAEGGPAWAGPPGSRSRVIQGPIPQAASVSTPVLPRVASGEAAAVEECLDRYGGLVWSLARRYCSAVADAEDAVQEVFVELWRCADRFDPDIAAEATFVTMIARRRIIDLLRRRRAPQRDEALVEDVVDPAATHEFGGVERTEEVERIRAFMVQLRDEERRVLELAISEGLSQSKIAQITGWPLGTVKSHARRGMAKLRDLVGASPQASEADSPNRRREAT